MVSTDGVAGMTTVRLSITLDETQSNIYTIYGSPGSGTTLSVPAAFQVDTPFGANVGGVSPAFFETSADSEFDSWLTVGVDDGSAATDISSIGIDFSAWTVDSGLEVSDGAVFWFEPIHRCTILDTLSRCSAVLSRVL